MPAKKTAKKQTSPAKHTLLKILTLLALCMALLIGYMAVEAAIVRVEYADVYLNDLPAEFDGTRILFLSDLHVDHFNSSERAAELVNRLQTLAPDLLLLGGDYSSTDISTPLLTGLHLSTPQQLRDQEQTWRDRFFLLIQQFDAPLGKYGVRGNHDVELDALREAMLLGDVTLLQNQAVEIHKDGATLLLVGLDDWAAGEQAPRALAQQVNSSDCALVLSHNPDALPSLNNQPARDGGAWVDLMLSGHTHGGQITLFGYKPLLLNSIYGERYWRGWISENRAHLLVSNGVGATFVPLRLGAPPQAHLITLHRR